MANNTQHNKIKTNSKFDLSNNKFRGETHIGDKNIINDNSVNYEENISDIQNIESLSFYVTNKFGDEKVSIAGIIGLLAGLLSIFTSLNSITTSIKIFSWLPSFSYNVGIWLMAFGIILIALGSVLLNALRYKQASRCQNCEKNYAYREYKKKKVRETDAREGTKKEIIEYLRCRFCHYQTERNYTLTIPYDESGDD